MCVAAFKPTLLHNSIIRFNLNTQRGRTAEENISLGKFAFVCHYRMDHNQSVSQLSRATTATEASAAGQHPAHHLSATTFFQHRN